ncbi:hypothetical protein D9M71_793020 [compost metagenome]
MADQRGAAQHLVAGHRFLEALDGAVEVVDALHLRQLRHLRHHLGVVHGLERILVLQLLGHQAQEVGLVQGVLLLGGAAVGCVQAQGAVDVGVADAAGAAHDGMSCNKKGQRPMVRVASASSLAVVSISTPAW